MRYFALSKYLTNSIFFAFAGILALQPSVLAESLPEEGSHLGFIVIGPGVFEELWRPDLIGPPGADRTEIYFKHLDEVKERLLQVYERYTRLSEFIQFLEIYGTKCNLDNGNFDGTLYTCVHKHTIYAQKPNTFVAVPIGHAEWIISIGQEEANERPNIEIDVLSLFM